MHRLREVGLGPALQQALQRLDEQQLDAVTSDDPALLLRAQVGSGKTTVLTCKIAWLHAAVGIPLRHIAVLTFTNRAADEIRRRVAALLPDTRDIGRELRLAGTFHAVARTMLARRLPIATLGYRPGFTVMDDGERQRLWARLIAEHGLVIRHRRQLAKRMAALALGELLHGNMRRPDDLVRLAELCHADKLSRNAMDFDDLIANAHALLCEYPLSPPLRWLLIDELQDCDRDQLELVDRMLGPDTRVFAVGDPNQVIYSWRGSGADVFADFAARHDARLATLRASHRCPPAILEPARLLLSETGPAVAGHADADLVAAREGGEVVTAMPHHDDAAQARWITARVQAALNAGAAAGDLAILGRTRRVVAPIARALVNADIAVQLATTERRLDDPVGGWLYTLLRAGLDPADDERFCLALADRHRGLCTERTLTVARLQKARESGAEAPREHVLRAIARRSRGRRKAVMAVAVAVEAALPELGRLVADDSPERTSALVAALRLDDMLGPTSSSFAKDRATCLELIEAWLQEVDAAGADSAEGLLVALETVARAPAARRPQRGVAVLTMHAVKGLEFEHVIIASCNDGLIPLAAAWRDPAQLAEERRLLFVAMTRARERVEIGWLTAPVDRRIAGEPSPLLELLPAGAIDWLPAPPDPNPARPRPTVGFAAGDRVRHKRYGDGEVQRADADAILVTFGSFGERRFSPRLCPLKRIG